MKILFILPQIPYPPHSGGRIVTWNTIKRFAKHAEVSVVCLFHHGHELQHLDYIKKVCKRVRVFPAHPKWTWSLMIKSIFSKWPYKAHRFYNKEMQKWIEKWIEIHKFDIIHVQNFYPTTYIKGNEPGLKIHYKENVEGKILRRLAKLNDNPLLKWAIYFESKKTLRFELEACEKFDQVLTISPEDREILLKMNSKLNVRHQRPGVDLESYPFLDEPDGPPSIVFTGTMSYYPNHLGVMKFLKETWPKIRQAISGIECWIVGDEPSQSLRDFNGKDGIHITGRVPMIQPYMEKGLIYIIPLEIGGGIRLKVLEAMSAGRAVVSTSVGCEGLDVQHDEHLKIAEMPDDFANAVVSLVKNQEERNRLRYSARQWIENYYDWDVVIDQQLDYYRSLLQLSPASANRADSD